MPVRSSTSSVLAWPAADAVRAAVRELALELTSRRPEVVAVGYFGSLARGDWCFGSDVDLVAVVAADPGPRLARASAYDITRLPVPVDLLVYTEAELAGVLRDDRRFARVLRHGTVWVTEPPPDLRR